METIKEYFNGLFESTSDRIKSVFLSSYTIAFVIYNWQIFAFLLFSKEDIEDKLYIINTQSLHWGMFVWPLLIAIIYVFLLPWINIGVDKLLTRVNNIKYEKIKDTRKKKLEQKREEALLEFEIEQNRAGTTEIASLKNQIDQKNQELTELRQSLEATNEKFNKFVKSSKEQIEALETENKNLKGENNNLQTEIFEINNLLNQGSIESTKVFRFRVGQIINSLTNEDERSFIELSKLIKSNISIENNFQYLTADDFIEKGLFFQSPETNSFKFTPLGQGVYEVLSSKYNNTS